VKILGCMKKVYIDYDAWSAIFLGETGLPLMEEELYEILKKLASLEDVVVVLRQNNEQLFVLKFNVNTSKFEELPIDDK